MAHTVRSGQTCGRRHLRGCHDDARPPDAHRANRSSPGLPSKSHRRYAAGPLQGASGGRRSGQPGPCLRAPETCSPGDYTSTLLTRRWGARPAVSLVLQNVSAAAGARFWPVNGAIVGGTAVPMRPARFTSRRSICPLSSRWGSAHGLTRRSGGSTPRVVARPRSRSVGELSFGGTISRSGVSHCGWRGSRLRRSCPRTSRSA